jgi:hypothetical protein
MKQGAKVYCANHDLMLTLEELPEHLRTMHPDGRKVAVFPNVSDDVKDYLACLTVRHRLREKG